jgi:hypothetical protein
MNRRDLDAEDLERLFCEHPCVRIMTDATRIGQREEVEVCIYCKAVNPPKLQYPADEQLMVWELKELSTNLIEACYEFGARRPLYT